MIGSSVSHLPVLGLVGGIASGKSLIAQLLAQHGAIVLDADRAGHEVLRDPAVQQELRFRFGNQIFTAKGDVDRKSLAAIVFADPEALKFLECLTHPRIAQRLQEQLAELQQNKAQFQESPGQVSLKPAPIAAVLDAPVMLKAGWDRLCDEIWFIDAPADIRLQRALERGWTPEEFASREAAQEPLWQKRDRAQCTIDNSGALESTAKMVERCWNAFLEKFHQSKRRENT